MRKEWPFATAMVEQVASEERWKDLLEMSEEGRALVVEFTATWCKPSHAIHPYFEASALECSATGNKIACGGRC